MRNATGLQAMFVVGTLIGRQNLLNGVAKLMLWCQMRDVQPAYAMFNPAR